LCVRLDAEGACRRHRSPAAARTRSCAARLESAEAAWAQRAEADRRAAAARLEELGRQAAAQRAAGEAKWQAAAGEAEGRWRRKLDELRDKWAPSRGEGGRAVWGRAENEGLGGQKARSRA
jgi:hypothetical protein